MVMKLARLWRHANTGSLAVRRHFPGATLDAIAHAIQACEGRHGGEIRFAVEDSLALLEVWRGLTPREVAVRKFAELGVWDTANSDGVLIYVLLADRDVEIVADRGVGAGKVPQDEWEQCCRVMEAHFREGRFREGAVAGIEAVAAVLARHPAGPPDAGNELPDRPAVL
jgi:uncharacterized membrane protein YgcG